MTFYHAPSSFIEILLILSTKWFFFLFIWAEAEVDVERNGKNMGFSLSDGCCLLLLDASLFFSVSYDDLVILG